MKRYWKWCKLKQFLTEYYLLKFMGWRWELHLLPCFTNLSFNFPNFQEDAGRMSEENGGIATTGKIRRTKRGDGRGGEKGSERGRETQVNVKTLITGTKRSTGIAEATTQTQSPLKTALYSSALDRQSPAPPPVILLQNLPILTHCSPPSTPLCRGVAATCMIWI